MNGKSDKIFPMGWGAISSRPVIRSWGLHGNPLVLQITYERNERMKVELSSGEYRIVASGTTMTVANNPLEVYLTDDTGNRLYHIRFSFATDSENGDPVVRSTGIDNGAGIELLLVNFNNSLGRGVATPMVIASQAGRDALFLTFTVTSHKGVESKQIFYTIYTRAGR